MKGYKLVKEHDKHFEVSHPKDGVFRIAKSQLSPATQRKVRALPKHMDEGGESGDDVDTGGDDTSGDMMGGESPAALQAKMVNAANPDSQVDVPTDAPPSVAQMPIQDAASATPDQVPMQSAENNPNITPPGASTGSGNPPQNPYAQASNSYDKAFGETAAGLKTARDAQQAAASEMAATQQNYAKQAEAFGQKMQADWEQNDAANKQLMQAYQNGTIDPSRVWSQASTGNKIAAGIGILLSGIGSGLTGQRNMAMDVIQKTIDRDIEAQKAELGKTGNLLSLNMQKYGNIRAAYAASMSQLYAATQGQLASSGAKLQGAQAQAQYQQAMGELDMKRAEFQRQAAAWNAFSQGGNAASGGGLDLNRLRLGVQMGIVPKDALKEAGDYQKLTNSIGAVNKAFDQVDKLQTTGNRLGSPIQSARQIDATKKIFSAQLAKDLEGRATPQDIDSLMENFPDLTDSDKTRKTKLLNLHNSIKSKYSFPNLQAFGLLAPNDSTITPVAGITGTQKIAGGG